MNLRVISFCFFVCCLLMKVQAQFAGAETELVRVAASGEVGLSVVIDQASPVIGCGQPVTLTATITGATEISWLRNGEYINGATTPTFVANQSGIYSVVVVSLLCQLESAPVEVVLLSPLNAAILAPAGSSACTGSSVELQATGGTAEWQWYRNGVALPDGLSSTYTATLPGQYVVIGNQGSICESSSTPLEVVIYPLPSAIIAWQENPLICAGDSAEILANVAPNQEVVWYQDETEVSSGVAQLQADVAGEYHALFTDTLTGCSAVSGSIFLEVFPTQSVEIIAQGPLGFCAGESQTLSLAAGQGEIRWQADGVLVEGAAEPALIVFSSATYTAELTDENGCVSRSNELLIEALPLPNAMIQYEELLPILCGDADTLYLTLEPGYEYVWYNGETALPEATINSLLVTEPGVYTVNVTGLNGCSASSEALEIIGYGMPDVELLPSGAINLCSGQGQFLEAIAGTAIQYSWYMDGVLIEGVSESVWQADNAGVYWVSVIDENGCEAVSEAAQLEVIEVATPVIVSGGITPEGQLLLTDEASGHQWYLSGEMIQGATTSTYVAVEDGIYSVIVIEDVCESEVSEGFEVVLGGVDSSRSEGLLVYPNPCSDRLNIAFGGATGVAYSVYDSYGRIVISGFAANARMVLDVQSWSVGMYSLVAESGERVVFMVTR
jgi:hypothetical protein